MSLHYADVKSGWVSFLAEIVSVEPSVEATATQLVQPLSDEQELLVSCWRSGQIEPEAWQRHLDKYPVLAAHFRGAAVTH